MGRKKIEIKLIKNARQRRVSYCLFRLPTIRGEKGSLKRSRS